MRSPFGQIKNIKPLFRGRLPAQLVIQYSNRCNANCPQCGMRRSENISRFTLDKRRVKRIIDAAAAKGVRSLSITGGEPLMFLDDIVELINHASRAGIPYVRTGTNGFIFKNSDDPGFPGKMRRIAEQLAATDLYTFWISLDSANPSDHEKIRGLDGVVRGIEKALPIFHEHSIYPAVNLGINRATGGSSNQPYLDRTRPDDFFQSFKASFERFYQVAVDLGFTMVNACYPMSSGEALEIAADGARQSLYGAISSDSIVTFSNEEKALIFKALYETIPKFRGRLRIFSPRCSLYALIRKFADHQPPLFPCRGGSDFFFVECEQGTIHPCGYIENPHQSLPDLDTRLSAIADCDKCEWECFRDPSDVLGPFAELFTHPVKLLGKVVREPRFFKLLKEDLSYFRACNFFSGRHAPQIEAMQRFQHP